MRRANQGTSRRWDPIGIDQLTDLPSMDSIDRTINTFFDDEEVAETEPVSESTMRVTRGRLSRIIKEELQRVLYEGKCDKASGHEGCIRKREKGWVVISNKTGECWGRSKKDDDAECTYYDSKKDAKEALGGYHRG